MQTKKIKVQTPAKINLSLEILDRMPNGFHTLSSVMQTVSLFDYITLEKTEISGDAQILLSGTSDKIPYDEKNIVHKVIKSYFDELNIKGVKIQAHIEKNIPTEAGLAGGSTNAAGALIAINELFNNELSMSKIHELAAKAGSDLNFCLEGGACLLSSRGEIIDKKLPYKAFDLMIIKPKNIAVSTPMCYKNYSAKFFEKKLPYYSTKIVELFEKDVFSVKELAKYLYNDLEKPALEMHSQIAMIKDDLIKAGAINSLMSGSGSSVFALIESDIDYPKNLEQEIFRVSTTSKGCEII